MDHLELLSRRARVQAPPGFEQAVLVRLAEEKRRRLAFGRVVRLAWAGGSALFLAGILSLSLIDRSSGPEWTTAAGPDAVPSGSVLLPIMETIDYGREIRTAGLEPRTIYILEQVSDTVSLRETMY